MSHLCDAEPEKNEIDQYVISLELLHARDICFVLPFWFIFFVFSDTL